MSLSYLGGFCPWKKSLFTIRKKKAEKHPQVIVGANRTSFDSVTLTHGSKSGHRNNLKLKSNPDPSDSRTAYIKKRIIRDFKFRFSKAFYFKNIKIAYAAQYQIKKTSQSENGEKT